MPAFPQPERPNDTSWTRTQQQLADREAARRAWDMRFAVGRKVLELRPVAAGCGSRGFWAVVTLSEKVTVVAEKVLRRTEVITIHTTLYQADAESFIAEARALRAAKTRKTA